MSSNLVKHAKVELEKIGEDPEVIRRYCKVIKEFDDIARFGGMTDIVIPTLNELLQFKNLSPLTDDPDEWIYHNPLVSGKKEGLWQSTRNLEAFSTDAGKSYYVLSDETNTIHYTLMHESVPVTEET